MNAKHKYDEKLGSFKGSNKSIEHPIIFTKQMKEICTKLNIKISEKCRVLINNSKVSCYMKANRKLRRKFRLLSASPDRRLGKIPQNLSCKSQDKVSEKQQLFVDRIMMREKIMRNLNIDFHNKELTHKIFDIGISLKYQRQIVAQ